MQDAGVIVPSRSAWASCVNLVAKPDGSIRKTIDYKPINKRTIKDAFPLPNIAYNLALLRQAKVFSKIDLMHGYNQNPLHKFSRAYTAFICEYGLFEFTRMPMGLTNATATFQRLMNVIFADVIGIFVIIYLDDIFIFSKTPEEHLEHVKEVIRRLKIHRLYAKLKKCEFFRTEIEFLGHRISEGEIHPREEKVRALMESKQPTNTKRCNHFSASITIIENLFENLLSLSTFCLNA